MYEINQPIVFDEVTTNEGSAFKNPNFTAPISGRYYFRILFDKILLNDERQVFVELRQEDLVVVRSPLTARCQCDHSDNVHIAIHVHLQRGENVWLQLQGDQGMLHETNHIFSGNYVPMM